MMTEYRTQSVTTKKIEVATEEDIEGCLQYTVDKAIFINLWKMFGNVEVKFASR